MKLHQLNRVIITYSNQIDKEISNSLGMPVENVLAGFLLHSTADSPGRLQG